MFYICGRERTSEVSALTHHILAIAIKTQLGMTLQCPSQRTMKWAASSPTQISISVRVLCPVDRRPVYCHFCVRIHNLSFFLWLYCCSNTILFIFLQERGSPLPVASTSAEVSSRSPPASMSRRRPPKRRAGTHSRRRRWWSWAAPSAPFSPPTAETISSTTPKSCTASVRNSPVRACVRACVRSTRT